MGSREKDRNESRSLISGAIIAGIFGVAVAGCATAKDGQTHATDPLPVSKDDSAPITTNATPTPPTTTTTSGKSEILFVNNIGGSNTIYVYPGTTDSAADTVPNGTFPAGEISQVDCFQEGRTIRDEDTWYRLSQVGSLPTYYATKAFAAPQGNIPHC